MPDLADIPFQFMTSYDNTASVGITFIDELHNFDLEKCGKVPVVTRLYVVEELEESERESTEMSQGFGGEAPKARKFRPCVVKTMH